jgi:hypothetical protein
MDAPKFDGTDVNKLVHWLMAVERCGVAQLIQDDTQMVSYALSNLRGRASEWAYSTLLADEHAFATWSVFKEKIRTMYQPPNNEVLLQAKFFSARQATRSLQQYVQEMRSIAASITQQPLAESVKVAAFVNGLRQGPPRQALFRKMPATMEEAIAVAYIEEQSFNSSVANPWQKSGGDKAGPQGQRHNPTPMDLSNADVVCYNCGKRGHVKARCYAKPKGGGSFQGRNGSRPPRGGKTPSARRSGGAPTSSENVRAQ